MFNIEKSQFANKEEFYQQFLTQARGLVYEEKDLIANMANISSLMFMLLEDINWAGFYLYKEGMLVLGPFHGKPACIRIKMGKGVCGTAAKEQTTQLVEDVHQFPGHIACDGDTNSEIVIPIIVQDKLVGVLDIDSPMKNRFDQEDKRYLEELVQIIVATQ